MYGKTDECYVALRLVWFDFHKTVAQSFWELYRDEVLYGKQDRLTMEEEKK